MQYVVARLELDSGAVSSLQAGRQVGSHACNLQEAVCGAGDS